MSREIKFRGWDGERILSPEDLSVSPGGRRWLGHVDVLLMQYTGLKDGNGKEIYEGDLIELKIDFGYGPQPVIASVIWEGAGWQFDSDAGCAYGSDAVGEVIGNIYENPDLLEQSAA